MQCTTIIAQQQLLALLQSKQLRLGLKFYNNLTAGAALIQLEKGWGKRRACTALSR